jgi:predicted O-methyltransferase YrrM
MKTQHFWQACDGYFTFQDFYRWLAGQMQDGAHIVEVGSYAGQSAAFLAVELLNRDTKATLDLVDWFQQVPVATVCQNLAPLAGRGIIGQLLQAYSWDGAKAYQDGILDAVFIDASHLYVDVAKDIDAWLPKVKPGGIIAGHDFTLEFPGVIQAVTERFERYEIWRGDKWSTDAPMVGKYYPVWCVRLP